jgi:YbbR domain-containing protein
MPDRRRTNPWFERLWGNVEYKALSALVALTAWWYVQGGQANEVMLRANVEWAFPNQISPAEAPPTSVTVEVSGSRSATRRAQREGLVLEANLSSAAAGVHIVDFDTLPIRGLPRGLSVARISPAVARVELEPIVTRKVKVELAMVGEPPAGFAVARTDVQPATLQVQGPRSVVGSLRQVSTRPLSITGLRANAEVPVELDLPWGVESMLAEPVVAQFEVETASSRRSFDAVPLGVRASGWTVEPRSVRVTLEGSDAALSAIRPADVAVFIDVQATNGSSALEAVLDGDGPARVRVVHPAMDKVRAIAIDPPSVEVRKP